MKRSPALDAVRGIAIILVLIWHYLPRSSANTPELLIKSTRMFWSGVDLFFVLSGFLIAGILLQNVTAKNYFSTFYIRRAARIVPLYLVILCLLLFVIEFSPRIIRETSVEHLPLWSYLTFTQNFLYASRERLDDPWIDVTWSLAIEEQFYIALSLLVRNLSRKKLMIMSVVLIILAPILRFVASNQMVAYLLPFHRADSLMFGVLLALMWQSDVGKEFLVKQSTTLRWSCLILFLVAAFLTYRNTPVGDAWGHFLLALFYCNLIVLALIQTEKPGRFSPLDNRVLEWFGLRSYGIYLFHKPMQILIPLVLAWLLHRTLSLWMTILIYTVVLLAVSELSYRLLEKPVMSWGHRLKYE